MFAGAPLFMWVYAVRTAVFICNISASFYSKQGIWSTPYMLIHGESFPDSSIPVSSVLVPISAAPSLPLGQADQPLSPFEVEEPAFTDVSLSMMQEPEEPAPRRSARTKMRHLRQVGGGGQPPLRDWWFY